MSVFDLRIPSIAGALDADSSTAKAQAAAERPKLLF